MKSLTLHTHGCQRDSLNFNPRDTKRVVVVTTPPTFLCIKFFHMEYNFCILGGCSRFIGAHVEVNIMVVAHAIQMLYPIYPRYQRGWIPPP